MPKKTIAYVVITVLLIIGYSYLVKPDGSELFVRSMDTETEKFERTWSPDINLRTNNLTDTLEVLRPMTMKKADDYFYVSDFSDFTIYYYNKAGELAGKFETGRGRGPGEFTNLTDFDVCGDTLWAVDIQNYRIQSFSLSTGDLLRNFVVENRPYRIACFDDEIIIQWFGAEYLFSTFNYNGDEKHQFGQLIEDQLQHSFSLNGTLISLKGEDRFVYLPLYASFIYHYRTDGELINILKAPDGVEFPLTKRTRGSSMTPEHSLMRNGWVNENDELYVYTRLPGDQMTSQGEWTGEPRTMFDVYNLREARYQTSFNIPFEPSAEALFTGDRIYSRTDSEVQIHTFLD